MQFLPSMLLTASADGTCGAIDAQTGERISTFRGHTAIVTCCASTKCGPELTASGSIDGSIKIWDRNSPGIAESINLRRQYSVSSVAFSSTSDILFIAGSSHDIAAYDRRAMRVVYSLSGHIGAVTGIRLSPDGTRLLSSSMDNTVRIWDVSPYCDPSNHQLRILGDVTQGTDGHKTRPAWSNDGHLVGSGAANGNVRIWDVQTGQTIHTLSGYQAYVNQIDFHPEERKVVSCSTDKTLILQSHIHLNKSDVGTK
ncbi:U5 small nuclear ribonucleoprotein [Linnemannia zychae]|nr:U5 small nuclear ribonucleoprotein [Linnemannia zychae]